MKRQILRWTALLGCLSLAAADIDLGKAKIGTPEPERSGNVWNFTGGGMRLPNLWDFSKGVKIEVEFKLDPGQTNAMPRLVETPLLSLQFLLNTADPAIPKELRVLAKSGTDKDKYVLLRGLRLPGDGTQWNKAVVTYIPKTKALSLRLDDGKTVSKTLDFPWNPVKQYVMVGSNMLSGGHRSFNGSIRNLKITVPYDGTAETEAPSAPQAKTASATPAQPSATGNGEIIPGSVMTFGVLKPQVNGSELVFQAQERTAAGALLPGIYDYAKGICCEFDFRDELVQTNVFPRLVESRILSCQLEASGGRAVNRRVKIMVNAPDGTYACAKIDYRHTPDAWHHVKVEFMPEQDAVTLQLDNGEIVTERLAFRTPLPTAGQRIVIGAGMLNGSNRGFTGSIRDLRITTPYRRELNMRREKLGPPAINGVPVRHITVAAVPGRHHAFPGITRLPDGELAVVYREGIGHVDGTGRICMVRSKDNGENWSNPVTVADSLCDDRDPSIQTLSDGRVLLCYGGSFLWVRNREENNAGKEYHGKTAPEGFGPHFRFSTDSGRTWGEPVKIQAFTPHGPLFTGSEFYFSRRKGNDPENSKILFFHGSADGTEWREVGVIPRAKGDEDCIYTEPHTVRLPDGRLVTSLRMVRDGLMRLSYSEDNGKTWSEPVKTPVKGFPQHLLVLKDGRLLATYGYRYRPFGVRACISADGGKTWDMEHEMVIQNNGSGIDLGYPVSMELDNGEIATVYYNQTVKTPIPIIEMAKFRLP